VRERLDTIREGTTWEDRSSGKRGWMLQATALNEGKRRRRRRRNVLAIIQPENLLPILNPILNPLNPGQHLVSSFSDTF
jgi:hypothetical protein